MSIAAKHRKVCFELTLERPSTLNSLEKAINYGRKFKNEPQDIYIIIVFFFQMVGVLCDALSPLSLSRRHLDRCVSVYRRDILCLLNFSEIITSSYGTVWCFDLIGRKFMCDNGCFCFVANHFMSEKYI